MVQQLDTVEVTHERSYAKSLKEKMDEVPRSQVADLQPQVYRGQIVWFNAIGFLSFHILAVYAFCDVFTRAHVLTSLWVIFLMFCTGVGVTMGAHRLYSHKAFKAKPMFRLLLVTMHTLAGQNCLYIWVRDHRQHHKYSDTNGDPHNSTRGFLFSHIGWLMVRKHPDVIAKGKNVDLSDLEADAFVMFQKRYYKTLYMILSLGLPTLVPVWAWGESLWSSFMVAFVLRTVLSLNITWLVNSYAHMYGTRPYSRDIVPVETPLVSFLTCGEGWHNYHHTFPWDYKAAELGQRLNVTTFLLDAATKLGWVYDLRSATPDMVLHRVLKRGDGTHPYWNTTCKQTGNTQPERNVSRTLGS